jgi:nucleoside-diphosphate-sugar epimerase
MMRILFTGASSFTGMWIVKQLVAQGHAVTAVFQHPLSDYRGLRLLRVQALLPLCEAIFNCSFGTADFLEYIAKKGPWDLFCHHAADVTNYKSPDFAVGTAISSNVFHLKEVLEALLNQGCRKVLLTGSVFEQHEGLGTMPLKAFSPYGLSKGITSEIFQFYTEMLQMKLGKFVIPNPFGPFEEVRFTTYLIKKWAQGENALVSHPEYIRDNIHVSLLAKAYGVFAEKISAQAGFEKMNPSGYVGAQGAFTAEFAKQMRLRLGLACQYELQTQTDFAEPKERINFDSLAFIPWNEQQAWDDLAEFYRDFYLKGNLS